MKLERRGTLRADLSLVGITAIWGFTFPAVKLALQDAGPLSFLTARFALGALALLVIFRGRAIRMNRAGMAYGIVLGLCLGAGSALQTFGLMYTTASKSAFITALYVVLVPLIGFAALRVRPRATSLVAVAIAAAGLAEITSVRVTGFNIGDLLTLGCSLAFALHILVAEVATPHHDAVGLTFWQAGTTAALSGVAMLFFEHPRLPFTPWATSSLLVCGLLATALAFTVQMWAQRETSGTRAALVFAAEPVFASIFARLIQQDRLGVHGLIGGLLILAAIVVSEVGARRNGGESNGTATTDEHR